MSEKIKVFNQIIKSSGDRKEYRAIILENHLKCLLISDELTDRSAASIDVHSGFMLDPNEIPGLAHLCEHMLFMGSKKVAIIFYFNYHI